MQSPRTPRQRQSASRRILRLNPKLFFITVAVLMIGVVATFAIYRGMDVTMDIPKVGKFTFTGEELHQSKTLEWVAYLMDSDTDAGRCLSVESVTVGLYSGGPQKSEFLMGLAEDLNRSKGFEGSCPALDGRKWALQGFMNDIYIVASYRTQTPPYRGIGSYYLKMVSDGNRSAHYEGYWIGRDCAGSHTVKCPALLWPKGQRLGLSEAEAKLKAIDPANCAPVPHLEAVCD